MNLKSRSGVIVVVAVALEGADEYYPGVQYPARMKIPLVLAERCQVSTREFDVNNDSLGK